MHLFFFVLFLLVVLGAAWWWVWRLHVRLLGDVRKRLGPARAELLRRLFPFV